MKEEEEEEKTVETNPPSLLSWKYWKQVQHMATLNNERVYVTASPIAGLGLFANESFAKGDVITSYGGVLRDVPARWDETIDKRYMCRVPGTSFVLDGKPYAERFVYTAKWRRQQLRLPASSRTRLLPQAQKSSATHKSCVSFTCDPSLAQRYGSEMTRVLFPVYDTVQVGGCGYMGNGSSRAQANVCFRTMARDKKGLCGVDLFLVAKRPIAPHEELVYAYNNVESIQWTNKASR